VSKKSKLLERLQERPRDFTWDEACTLMKHCGFELKKGSGSARMFSHVQSGLKVRLHEPHPQNTLLRYMVNALIDALVEVGEISK
jgi:hypothetical protein